MPKTEIRTESSTTGIPFKMVVRQKSVLAVMGVAAALFVAVSAYMTFWGVWLSQEFAFDAVALGLTATIISFGELTGSLSSGLFIDRLGKRRGVLIGLFLSGFLFLLIPFFGKTPFTIRAALLATMVALEFSIVSLFPLYGEQAPEARATVFSLAAFGTAVGFAVGPTLATSLWDWKGVLPVTLVCAFFIFTSGFLVWRFLFEGNDHQ